MLSKTEKNNIANLLEAGMSISEMAKRMQRSTGTIRRYKLLYLQSNTPEICDENVSAKILPVKEFVDSHIKNGVTNCTRLYQLAMEQGYEGSYGLLNSYARESIITKKTDEHTYKPSAHVETEPGEQAQVDWASFGKILINGQKRRLYAFVYVLSYSRTMYVEFVVRQDLRTFQACHINAFNTLGIPRTIRYDNIKTVIIRRETGEDGTKKIHYNLSFLDFAKYYDFQPELCPPYWPRSKGKVESGVKYLRYNFMKGEVFGRTYLSIDDLNMKVNNWLQKVAHVRNHRGTGIRPIERWSEEKAILRFPNNLPIYQNSPYLMRRSTKDGLILYKSNLYQVKRLQQKKVFLREMQEHGISYLEIYYKDVLIKKYPLSSERGRWVADDNEDLESGRSSAPKKKRKERCKRISSKIIINMRDLSYYDSLVHN